MSSKYLIGLNQVLSWLFGAMALVIIVLLPIASLDVLNSVDLNDSENYSITPNDATLDGKDYTRVDINLVSLSELGQSAAIKVSGHRTCSANCSDYTDIVTFFAISKKDPTRESFPVTEAIIIPDGSSDFSKDFNFPVDGKFVLYPFDTYKIGVGITVERILLDKSNRLLSPEEVSRQYSIKLNESLLKMEVSAFKPVEPSVVKPKLATFDYAYSGIINFQRPLFIKIIDTIIMALVTFLALYTVIFMPFEPVAVNGGTVIFGLYGARTLVLGGYPSDTTLIDAIFLIVIAISILVLLIKAVLKFHHDRILNVLK